MFNFFNRSKKKEYAEQSIPLLSEIEENAKGRCWCCWEESETEDNPLIRVCTGCKDPDLQYIHQICIDKYISNLPHRDLNEDTDSTEESSGPDYYCTRCKHPYTVSQSKIHPIKVLVSDPFLWVAMTLMTSCVFVLTGCCLILLYQHWGTGNILFRFGPEWATVYMTTFSSAMLLFCWAVYVSTWTMVLGYCKGKTLKHVDPLDVEDILESQMDRLDGCLIDLENNMTGSSSNYWKAAPPDLEGGMLINHIVDISSNEFLSNTKKDKLVVEGSDFQIDLKNLNFDADVSLRDIKSKKFIVDCIVNDSAIDISNDQN